MQKTSQLENSLLVAPCALEKASWLVTAGATFTLQARRSSDSVKLENIKGQTSQLGDLFCSERMRCHGNSAGLTPRALDRTLPLRFFTLYLKTS